MVTDDDTASINADTIVWLPLTMIRSVLTMTLLAFTRSVSLTSSSSTPRRFASGLMLT